MSVEEELGWSIRDNHCSTFKQYILSAFTPKGRLGRRDFFISFIIIIYLYGIAVNVPYFMFMPNCGYGGDWFYGEILNVASMTHVALFFIPETLIGVFGLAVDVINVFTTSDATEQAMMIYLVAVVIFFDYLIFCCCIRRLHDMGSVMKNLAFWFIPFFGVFILSFFLLFTADEDTNKYGSDPRKPYEGQYDD